MKLYLTGILAYETARRLYEADRARFESRFPRFFLQEFENLSEQAAPNAAFLDKMCIEKNTKTIYSRNQFFYNGSVYVREINEGGIFASLWETCEDLKQIRREAEEAAPVNADVGCSVRLFDIPLDQRVVELLEYAGENPYEVPSAGCLLVAAGDAELPEELTEIGTITNVNERILLAGEKKRFLTPPERQAKDIEDRRGSRPRDREQEQTL